VATLLNDIGSDGGCYLSDIANAIARSPVEEITRALVQLLHERGGRGPTRAKTHWAGDDTILVIFGDCFTSAERALWSAGCTGVAERYRQTVQEVLRDDMCRLVGRATGRTVLATMGCAHHEPDVMAQIFLLAPLDGTPPSAAERA
jgi:uncharacterized protein YbcI